jgi:anti-sigma factor RsiW
MTQSDDPREGKELWKRFSAGIRREGRASCPDESDLAAYADGRTSRRETRKLEAHFAVCPECLSALCDLRALLSVEAGNVPASVRARAKGLVREPVAGAGLSWLRLPALTLRSAAGWAASVAFVLASCMAGYVMGKGDCGEDGAVSVSSYMAPGFGLNGSDAGGHRQPGAQLFMGGAL